MRHNFSIFCGLLFSVNSVLACNGVFDPQTGICHQSNGYQIPGQLKGQSQPKDYWGALAIDVVNGKTSGSAVNRRNKQKANNDAIIGCENTHDCKVAISFKNSCGAIATNGKEIDTAASDPNPKMAEQKAITACNKKSSKACKIWIPATCSGVGY